MFKTTALMTAAIGMTVAAYSADAALVIHEPFNYATTAPINDGTQLGDAGHNTGVGLGQWVQTNSGSNEIDVAATGQTYNDTHGNDLVVSGNSFERANRVGQAAVNAPITGTLAANDGTTTWMTFLYQDRGFSGPDFGIALTSVTMLHGDAQALSASGVGVGVGINSVGGPARAIGSIVYDNTTGQSFTPEATASMNGPAASNLRLLAMKVNWNQDGTDDEIFVFDLTTAAGTPHDLTTVPAEGDAIATALVDLSSAEQASLTNLAVSETQVSFVDEIRVGSDWASVAPLVPEPGSLALLGLSGLLVARRRRG